MDHVPPLLLLVAGMMCASACGETSAVPSPGPEPSKKISAVCRNSISYATSVVDWELTVDPATIEGGQPFTAALDGIAIFDEAFLDSMQSTPLGLVDEIELVDLTATVRVRSGALGDDVTLRPEGIPHRCAVSPQNACNPENDLPDGGNSDCLPVEDSNRCGRFVDVPTSADCTPDGICARLEKSFQCESVNACVTGPLELPLGRDFGEYTADSEGTVVFGWVDDPEALTAPPAFSDPIGMIGMRMRLWDSAGVAFECAMAPSTPDEALVSFPIEAP